MKRNSEAARTETLQSPCVVLLHPQQWLLQLLSAQRKRQSPFSSSNSQSETHNRGSPMKGRMSQQDYQGTGNTGTRGLLALWSAASLLGISRSSPARWEEVSPKRRKTLDKRGRQGKELFPDGHVKEEWITDTARMRWLR